MQWSVVMHCGDVFGIHPEGVVVKVKEGLARALQKGYLLTSKECRPSGAPAAVRSLLLFAVIFTHISAIFITTSWAVNCAPRVPYDSLSMNQHPS